jgi:hypothetical protein
MPAADEPCFSWNASKTRSHFAQIAQVFHAALQSVKATLKVEFCYHSEHVIDIRKGPEPARKRFKTWRRRSMSGSLKTGS